MDHLDRGNLVPEDDESARHAAREGQPDTAVAHAAPAPAPPPPGAAAVPFRSIAVNALLAMALLYTAYLARDLLLPLTLATLAAVITSPATQFAKRRLHIPRAISALILLIGLVGVLLGGAALLSGPAVQWLNQAPEILRDLEYEIRHLDSPIDDVQEASEQVEKIAKMDGGEQDDVVVVRVQRPTLVSGMLSQARGAAVMLTLTLALLYFLLVSGETLVSKVVGTFQRHQTRQRANEALREIQRQISAYVVTITAINIGLGVAIGVAMMMLGLPNALLWGAMAATLNFIPYLGAVVGAVVVALVAMTTDDGGLGDALLAAGVFWGLTAFEGTLVTPLILGRRMTLNPAVLFAGILFWGWVWGVPGALLAAPMLVALKIVFDATPSLRAVGEVMGR